MKAIFYTILLALGFAATANAQQLKSGALCQVVTPGTGEKIKLNDVITFNVVQRNDKDSVMFSSYGQGQPIKMQVQPSRNVSDLMEVFTLLGNKDSAVVKVPVDSIFKGHEAEMPPMFKKGSFVTYNVKIERVQSLADAIAERDQGIIKFKAEETAASDAYIKSKGLVVKTTPSGLRYAVTKMGTKPRPASGDSVYVNYVGRSARDLKVFDTSIQAEAKAAGMDQPGRPYEPIGFLVDRQRVIKGWDEGLLLLNEGSKATFIIPSNLGYGDQGSQPRIAPFADLIFDVELVKVVHLQKPAAAKTGIRAKTKTTGKRRAIVKKKN